MSAVLHFPTYLIPSLPLWTGRKKVAVVAAADYEFVQSDSDSESDLSDEEVVDSKVKTIVTARPLGSSRTKKQITLPSLLTSNESYLICRSCQTQLCFASAIISKGFTGRHGRAFLTSTLLSHNIRHMKPSIRNLQTGAHTVSDVICIPCGGTIGWKYLHADDRTQRYKVGKYILETGKVVKVNRWEHVDEESTVLKKEGMADEVVEVDLDDEDELEELFLGIWDKEKVVKRREKRIKAEEKNRAK